MKIVLCLPHSNVFSTIPETSFDDDDHILTVSKHKSALVLRLKKRSGLEYGVAIQMPLQLVKKLAFLVKPGMSLCEVNKLDI
jgi:hypothetical protein